VELGRIWEGPALDAIAVSNRLVSTMKKNVMVLLTSGIGHLRRFRLI
jgi:hypothetical protein